MVNSLIPKIAAGIADMGGAGLPEAQYMYGRMLVEGRDVRPQGSPSVVHPGS